MPVCQNKGLIKSLSANLIMKPRLLLSIEFFFKIYNVFKQFTF